jgi:hypothetical protein
MVTLRTHTSILFAILALNTACANAQGMSAPRVVSPDVVYVPAGEGAEDPQWVKRLKLDPADPKVAAVAEAAKERRTAEKELRKIRYQYLAQNKHQPKREEGLARLRDYDTAALYPLLIDLFKDDQADVKHYLIASFARAENQAGDAALAWMGVYEKSPMIRLAAADQLRARIAEDSQATQAVRMVLYEGFRTRKNSVMVASAKLASTLNLVELMPWLIASQAVQQPSTSSVATGSGSGEGALAWILVGEQTAFVSDLTPVVGPNAVAFDPQLSVVTTGSIIRILDAYVIEYHVELHQELVDWSSREYGQNTGGLGYDYDAWKKWYDQDFVPHLAAVAAERQKQKELANAAIPATPAPTKSHPDGVK